MKQTLFQRNGPTDIGPLGKLREWGPGGLILPDAFCDASRFVFHLLARLLARRRLIEIN